ncbi:hypothetical protein PAHAL_9G103300 [Panicum hallii]|uniref:Uncharacterized protein n=1 Tax=Panicum hallii TaxID=206008 RepID=A0A2T8I0S5_9POAL|nr:hypothetical protein PAHAL_9G103300 [Panicum hallii]
MAAVTSRLREGNVSARPIRGVLSWVNSGSAACGFDSSHLSLQQYYYRRLQSSAFPAAG